MLNEQRFFEEFLALVGKQVEIGNRANGMKVQGRLSNTMFDSIIIETDKGPKVVRFEDILYVNSKTL